MYNDLKVGEWVKRNTSFCFSKAQSIFESENKLVTAFVPGEEDRVGEGGSFCTFAQKFEPCIIHSKKYIHCKQKY